MFVHNKIFVLTMILFVVLLWAGNFISISFLVNEVDVFTALTLRLALVALVLSPFLLKPPSKSDFIYLLICTFVLVPGHFGFLFLSILHTKSVGGISVLIQLSIPFSILLSWIIFKDKPNKLRITGLVIAFIGIIFLLYDPSLFNSRNAFLLAIISAFCLGVYFICVKKLQNIKSMAVIAWTSLLGAPMMYALMLYTNNGIESVLTIENNSTYYAFLYTVIAGSILGHGLWAYLVKTQDISFISPFLLLVPMVAVILSAIILKEEITISFIITSTIIVFGIFLVFISSKTQKK